MHRSPRAEPIRFASAPLFTLVLFSWLLLLAPGAVASAQPYPDTASPAASPPPAHLSVVEGAVAIESQGQVEAAGVGTPLFDGDRVRTGEGRAELILADGSVLHLDRQTTLDIVGMSLFSLFEGQAFLILTEAATHGPPSYRIDGPGASMSVDSPGEYRISVFDQGVGGHVALAVVRGRARIFNAYGAVDVQAGERAVAFGGGEPGPAAFYAGGYDAFDRWSEARRSSWAGAASVQYLPTNLSAYAGTFDRHGYWAHEASYGWVWYPRVAVGWRPYSRGSWVPYRHAGIGWAGWDPWDWPTHHYGSWGVSFGGSWYWIPGRVWGPAWVSWATAPGYVAWCPLGYNGRPVVGFGVNLGYGGRGWGADPWFAWNVAARSSFAYRVPVHRYAVAGRALPPRTRSSFVVHGYGPGRGSVASAPHGAGGSTGRPVTGIAVPRASVSRSGVAPRIRTAPGGAPPARPSPAPRTIGPQRTYGVPTTTHAPRTGAVPRAGARAPVSGGERQRPGRVEPPPPAAPTHDGRSARGVPDRRPPTTQPMTDRPSRPSPPHPSPRSRAPQGGQTASTGRAPDGPARQAGPARSPRATGGSSVPASGGRVAGPRGSR